MKDAFQRSANIVFSGAGWMRAATVQGEPIQGFFPPAAQKPWKREFDVRLEERRQERRRIARELHDTLFQGFLGAS